MNFLILVAFSTLSHAAVSNCGTNSKFTITQLDQSPATYVTSGQNVSLTLKYTSFEAVEAGTVKTAVTYNFIPFQPSLTNLCDSIVCPLAPGEHDGSSSLIAPSGLSGTLQTTITWTDDNGNQLLCIRSSLSISTAFAEKPSIRRR